MGYRRMRLNQEVNSGLKHRGYWHGVSVAGPKNGWVPGETATQKRATTHVDHASPLVWVQTMQLLDSLLSARLHATTRQKLVLISVPSTRVALLDRLGLLWRAPLAEAEPTRLPFPPHLGHHVALRKIRRCHFGCADFGPSIQRQVAKCCPGAPHDIQYVHCDTG